MSALPSCGQAKPPPDGVLSNGRSMSTSSTPKPPREGKARPRRTCALDLGGARVGVAIDDELGLMAHPRGVLDGKNRPALLEALKALADEHEIGRFVVGLPLD